jgi:putative ABC transport system ATP-binding protein
MLRLENIRCQRGQGKQAFSLEIASLSLAPAEMVVITGRSGSGKSTLLEILGLVLRPQRADTFYWWSREENHRQDIAALWRSKDQRRLAAIRARHIGFVLQTGGLLPYLNVRENIAVNRHLLGLSTADVSTRRLAQKLEITHLLEKMPHQLSIGERQRIAIARALAHGPSLLLADEPTAALDPGLADTVMALMVELVAKTETTAVIATHERDRVRHSKAREIRAVPLNDGYGYASRFGG